MRDVTPFLEISTLPDLLNNSNPPLSAMRNCPDVCRAKVTANIMELPIRSVPASGKRQRRQSSCTRAVSESRSNERLYFFVSVVFSGFERFDELDVFPQMHPILWIHFDVFWIHLRRIA